MKVTACSIAGYLFLVTETYDNMLSSTERFIVSVWFDNGIKKFRHNFHHWQDHGHFGTLDGDDEYSHKDLFDQVCEDIEAEFGLVDRLTSVTVELDNVHSVRGWDEPYKTTRVFHFAGGKVIRVENTTEDPNV